jgi:Na+/H+ antiporter NhaA
MCVTNYAHLLVDRLVVFAMFLAYVFRKWHYRLERATHQSWIPYVLICGTLSWIGLIKAKLHPALALVPIVPFMPGPSHHNLESLDESVEEKLEDSAADGGVGSGKQSRANSSAGNEERSAVLDEHFNHARGRGTTIQAGLYAGLVGHSVPDSLKVIEYDEDGHEHLNASTLDEFEHFWKVYVDFGLFLFALCNAGVQIKGAPGGMTWLILLSLIIGKYCGIMFFFKVSKKCFNYPAPLGIRTRHIRMIGLIASLGLTVALFVSDVAFTDDALKDDARLGALLSGFVGFACYAISTKFDFAAEDVEKEVQAQIAEVSRHSDHVGRLCMTTKEQQFSFFLATLVGDAGDGCCAAKPAAQSRFLQRAGAHRQQQQLRDFDRSQRKRHRGSNLKAAHCIEEHMEGGFHTEPGAYMEAACCIAAYMIYD